MRACAQTRAQAMACAPVRHARSRALERTWRDGCVLGARARAWVVVRVLKRTQRDGCILRGRVRAGYAACGPSPIGDVLQCVKKIKTQ
jgi:hypothetical protein